MTKSFCDRCGTEIHPYRRIEGLAPEIPRAFRIMVNEFPSDRDTPYELCAGCGDEVEALCRAKAF